MFLIQHIAPPTVSNLVSSRFSLVRNHEEENAIQELIDHNLTSHFQPIVNLDQGKIFAYEALCRTIGPNPFDSIEELFREAKISNKILQLDMRCRENGIALSTSQGIKEKEALLFLNICPTSLLCPSHTAGTTGNLAHQYDMPIQNIVLEITEQEAVSNYQLFRKAVDHYRSKGFRIAIDDFGAGYGGLKMLSVLEPDFVKIDQHFFKDTPKSNINFNLIDSIATACHRIGIDVIAEGIENENDLRICREIGIDLVQGYLLARPVADLTEASQLNIPVHKTLRQSGTILFDEVICIGDIATFVPPLSSTDRTLEALNRFNDNPGLLCIPVMENGRLNGLINRHRFMENHMVGRFGYGLSLNYYKKVGNILEENFLQVPHYSSVEEVARKIHLRQQISVYDDICVTRSGKYIGTVSVSAILNAVTENSMMLARGANPLTGLPGNEFIQRQIAKMLSQSIHFDVCYIDIDCFKPFNDRHGFEMGDRVIKAVADIMVDGLKKWEVNSIGFAGHIGGDDFILITRPRNSIPACQYIIDQFTRKLSRFHTPEECRLSSYTSCDRRGNTQQFGLLSLSIGIVSTEIHLISSFAEVSSIASDLKKRAKETPGSVIVRDRRMKCPVEQTEPASLGTKTTGNRMT
jgi:diguanylate cyclase (GGDEF)-like protein